MAYGDLCTDGNVKNSTFSPARALLGPVTNVEVPQSINQNTMTLANIVDGQQ